MAMFVCTICLQVWQHLAVYHGATIPEVARLVPDAVVRGEDGYLRVDYDRLGLRLMTWAEWKLSQAYPN